MAEQINQDITIPDDPPSSRDKVNFRLRADDFVAWMKVFATQMNSLIPKVNASLSWINTNVQNALSYSQTATAQAGVATTKAGEASASAAAAHNAQLGAEAALDTFDDKYLGAKSTFPTTDNDGDPLQMGATFFKSSSPKGHYVYDSELQAWQQYSFVPTAHGSLSGRADADAHPINSIIDLTDELEYLDKKVTLSGVTAYHLLSGKLSLENFATDVGFSTTLYTGNGGTQSITTGVDMSTQWGNLATEKFGGLIWVKDRSTAYKHVLIDSVRGNGKAVYTSETSAEFTQSAHQLTSTGFDLTNNADNYVNKTGDAFVAWNFQTTHRASSTWGSPELITNGNFDTNLTGWTVGGGISAQWVSGKAEITWLNTSSTYCMYQTIPTVAGKKYTLKVTSFQSNGADNLYMKVGNSANDGTIVNLIQSVGNDHLITFTATTTTTYISLFFGENIGDKGYIDNVSVKECHTPTNHGKFWECHYNPFTGFTIVKYEGSGNIGHEIPHHLGRKSGLCHIKNLNATTSWTSILEDGRYLNLNDTVGATLTSSPTVSGGSTDFVIIVHTNGAVNALTNQYIMYGWANSYLDKSNTLIGNYEIGVYQGTGVTGKKVNTRAKPAMLLTKCISGASDWCMLDNKRPNGFLYPDLSSGEQTANWTPLMDGFTLDNVAGNSNSAGATYLYMIVYDNDSGSGKSKYPRATDTSSLNLNALIPFAQGIDSKGTKNTILTKNETLSGLTFTEGKNYVYAKSDGSYGVKPYAPQYNTYNGFGDYFDVNTNKWYQSPSIFACDFSDGSIAGWTVGTAGTLSVVGGVLKLQHNGTNYPTVSKTFTGLIVGKKYTLKVDLSCSDGISTTPLLGFTGLSISQQVYATGQHTVTGVATASYVNIQLMTQSTTLGVFATLDNLVLYPVNDDGSVDISDATEITESRNYLDAIVYADAGGQVTYVEQLSKVEYKDIINANEFQGKNACTAWASVDGITTPIVINDSFNISSIIRISTGVFRLMYKKRLDNANVSLGGSTSGSTTQEPKIVASTRDYIDISVSLYNANAYNDKFCIQIFGGKE